MLGALLGVHALFELAEDRRDIFRERRTGEHVEHAAHREQRVALAARDRDGGVAGVDQARGGAVVDQRQFEAHAGIDEVGEVAADGLDAAFGTIAKKVPLGVLQQLMGHREVTTTMRYVDVSKDDKRDAISIVVGAPRTNTAGMGVGKSRPTASVEVGFGVAATWQQSRKSALSCRNY